MCQIPGSAKDVSEGEMGWARRERHAYVMGVTATHDGDGDDGHRDGDEMTPPGVLGKAS